MAKAAGYYGRLIFLANGVQQVTHISYVGRYVGLVQSRRKKMSRRTIGFNLVVPHRKSKKRKLLILLDHRRSQENMESRQNHFWYALIASPFPPLSPPSVS
jgi:hypothetical protein